jgi:hypothetical protein
MPSVAPTAAATEQPAQVPTATPSAQPTATTATPAPTATPKPVLVPPNAPPRILSVHISSTNVTPGDEISGSVVTTSNVASLEARIATYSIVVPKTDIGTFRLTYKIPEVPFFLRGNYTLMLIARNTRGDHTTKQVPITVR